MERPLELEAVERPSFLYPIEVARLRACQHPIEGWLVDFYSGLMTDAFTESLEARVAEVAAIDDLVQRGLAARHVRDQLARSDRTLHAMQQAVLKELKPGRTWAEVGRMFGRSHSWAEALATGRSSKRRKTEHASDSTAHAGAAEGQPPVTEAPPEP